ncbi:hypothetical protein DUNSADRAFT_1572 [Dunaliella salina]|uniref:Tetratricopeptide repeat protein n=1 Tax=Dunaliella salina TaxID=3046 RepID=A0ABQ7H8F5_DUNSA|nr:hypothetical protein DUNSADRAFT_1572 [Dunaliella salina]|eukprot:KAF5843145.1 hypothetical protein DUNSADRAFT_1572 [Dunaliella salina]
MAIPVFVVTGVTLRMMGGVGWPGLATEGALWFPNLTQVAMVSSYTEQGTLALDFPMGPAGFVLPLAIFAATLTSLRIGFGAAGTRAAPADDWVGQALKVLPPLLYGMTFINLWVKLQLPHCALLHWAASSAFTLGLQVSLQQPAFRAAFNLPSPKDLQELLGRLAGQQLQELEDASGSLAANSRGYVVSALPEKLVKQVSEETSSDILVVLGAQHSAQRRYREALYCLDRALQMEPGHVRAHYSRGQVFSLSGRWLDAQACFERAAELAPPGSTEKGQATYCIATAMHTQGNLAGATQAYQQAAELWPNQPVISFSLANVLLAQKRPHEARRVVEEALGMAAMRNPRAPFRQQFMQLLERIDNALSPGSQQT